MLRQYKKIAGRAASHRYWELCCQHDCGFFLIKHHAPGPVVVQSGHSLAGRKRATAGENRRRPPALKGADVLTLFLRPHPRARVRGFVSHDWTRCLRLRLRNGPYAAGWPRHGMEVTHWRDKNEKSKNFRKPECELLKYAASNGLCDSPHGCHWMMATNQFDYRRTNYAPETPAVG
jgi:hypothetical protein